MSEPLKLNIESLHQFGKEKLKELLTGASCVNIEMACWSHNFAQDPNDVAYDYLQAIYIGEHILPFCTDMISQEVFYKEKMHPQTFIRFSFIPTKLEPLVTQLMRLSALIGEEDDDEIMLEKTEELDTFLEFMENNEIHFPELEDKYYAYCINEDDEIDDEF